MISHANSSPSWTAMVLAVLLIPASGYGQYNLNRKKPEYTIPVITLPSTSEPLLVQDNPKIQKGTNASRYLTRWQLENQNGVRSSFHVNAKPSTTSIEKAILYQRSTKQKVDLSMLAQLGYSLFHRGHLYMPQNDMNTPAIIK